jgi:hypothetical protein
MEGLELQFGPWNTGPLLQERRNISVLRQLERGSMSLAVDQLWAKCGQGREPLLADKPQGQMLWVNPNRAYGGPLLVPGAESHNEG